MIFALAMVMILPCKGFPQQLNPPDTVYEETDSIVKYIDPMEYAFMMHEDTKWLVKAGIIVLSDYTNKNPLTVSFEHRLLNSFTFDISLDNIHIDSPEYTYNLFAAHFSLDARWYYRLSKRMKERGIARSMSDNYLAAGFEYTHVFDNGNNDDNLAMKDYLAFSTKWGIQRRFLRHGYADMGIKVGVMNAVNEEFKPSFVMNSYVEMGLCFTKDLYKLERDRLCPFLKCYEADQYIFKSNLSNGIGIGIFENNKWISISPNLSFEHKIGHTPFSLNSELIATFGYAEYLDESTQYERYILTGISLEGRWYYNLKKSIRNGLSGNGLSANYVTAGGVYYKVFGENNEFDTQTGPQLFVAAGWQRLFSKHLYFDIQIGVNYLFEPDRFQNLYEPRFKFSLGYRF